MAASVGLGGAMGCAVAVTNCHACLNVGGLPERNGILKLLLMDGILPCPSCGIHHTYHSSTVQSAPDGTFIVFARWQISAS